MADPFIPLVQGTTDTGQYGNKYPTSTDLDADGEIGFTFATDPSGGDLVLDFQGYDIDYDDEVEVFLNGVSLGLLDTGVNNDVEDYQFIITAAQQDTVDDVNELVFKQVIDTTWKWGVTNLLVSEYSPPPPPPPPPPGPDVTLTIGSEETGQYGNKYPTATDLDADGEVVFGFDAAATPVDLTLEVDGYDVDFSTEVEVLLNGVSIGFLAAGVNDGLRVDYTIPIAAGDQNAGVTNTVTFRQAIDTSYKWGVTNLLLTEDALPPPPPPPDPVIALTIGSEETGQYGNKYPTATDLEEDGEVVFSFEAATTPVDLTLEVDGYDVDSSSEVEVLLDGVSIGFLAAGVNNGLRADYTIPIAAGDQTSGATHEITFRQAIDTSWKWGVTNLLLTEDALPPPPPPPPPPDPVIALTIGSEETGQYGNKYPTDTDLEEDGEVVFSFDAAATPVDLTLEVDGYDVDLSTEVEVLLDGVSIGFLAAGVNNGLRADYTIPIAAGDQTSGATHEITFRQAIDTSWKWGVTNLLLTEDAPPPPPPPPDPVIALTIGTEETGQYGNKYPTATDLDADGEVVFSFDAATTPVDLSLEVDGYDVDFSNEVEVLLNGVSIGFLAAGVNDGLRVDYTIPIAAGDQIAGDTNEVTFRQAIDTSYKWGVTNLLLTEAAPPPPPDPTIELFKGTVDTGQYGNKYPTSTDLEEDGEVTFTFATDTVDLVLEVDGYDVDFDDEIEVLLNGVSLGFLDTGVNNGLRVDYTIPIALADQDTGDGINEITFRQATDVNWKWGVTNLDLMEDIA